MSVIVTYSADKQPIQWKKEEVPDLDALKMNIQNKIELPVALHMLYTGNVPISEESYGEGLASDEDQLIMLYSKGSCDHSVISICNKHGINAGFEVEYCIFSHRSEGKFLVNIDSTIRDLKAEIEKYLERPSITLFPMFEDYMFPSRRITDDEMVVDLFFEHKESREFKENIVLRFAEKYNENEDEMLGILAVPNVRVISERSTLIELFNKDIFVIGDVKENLFERFQIPKSLQFVVYDGNEDDNDDTNFVLVYEGDCRDDDAFYELEFAVLPTDDVEIKKICEENNIELYPPVNITNNSGKILLRYFYDPKSTVDDMAKFVEKEFGLPASLLVFYFNGDVYKGDVHKGSQKIINFFYVEGDVVRNLDVCLGVITSEPKNNKLCMDKEIGLLKTITLLLHDSKTVLKTYQFNEVLSYNALYENLPGSLSHFSTELFYNNNIINLRALKVRYIEGLFYDCEKKCVNENLNIVMALRLSTIFLDEKDVKTMDDFCFKHNSQYMRRIGVEFPNGKTKFLGVKSDDLEYWRDVKNKLNIGDKQKVLFQEKEQDHEKPLLELYVEQADLNTDFLKLTVVQVEGEYIEQDLTPPNESCLII
jgi:hypothetical protein